MQTPNSFLKEKAETYCNENHIDLYGFEFPKDQVFEFFERLNPKDRLIDGSYPVFALEESWALSSFE